MKARKTGRKPKTPTAPEKRKRAGQPSTYTPTIAEAICKRIANGEHLPKICGEAGMPDRVTIYRWMEKHEEFRNMYARSREMRADHYCDRLDSIVADVLDGSLDPQAARMAADTIKWQMAKMHPRTYGDRQEVAHTGADGGPIVMRWAVESGGQP
jgi:hypothetical protein